MSKIPSDFQKYVVSFPVFGGQRLVVMFVSCMHLQFAHAPVQICPSGKQVLVYPKAPLQPVAKLGGPRQSGCPVPFVMQHEVAKWFLLVLARRGPRARGVKVPLLV